MSYTVDLLFKARLEIFEGWKYYERVYFARGVMVRLSNHVRKGPSPMH